MLGNVVARVVEKRPISVIVRGTLERVLGADQRDAWFARPAQKQDTRTVWFSTVSDILSHVVLRSTPSVRAAYQGHNAQVGASRLALSHKLNGVETHPTAALGRYRAAAVRPLIAPLDGKRSPWWPGSRVKILDGQGIEASERRLPVWREVHAGAWPGTSWVVYEPAHGLVSDVLPCEDGQAQERSRLGWVLETVQANDLGMQDRNFCPWAFVCEMASRGAGFITRPQAGLPLEVITTWRSVGRPETGHVAEHRGQVRAAHGSLHRFRRRRVKRDQATRDGDRALYIRTHVPLRQASATRRARLDRKRGTLATACQHLEASFHSEMTTLGYPKAALFGVCLALVAYNMWARVMAALRSVHGDTIEQELSLYAVANDIAQTYHGLRIALPADEWRVFSHRRPAELVTTLRTLAQKVRLDAYRNSPRGPKKPRPQGENTTKVPPVSTAQ